MKIIDKIEIKYFRSFDKFKVEIIDLKDINIFSGKNDSGKSNVLRALNLFFNYETDIGKPINFELDFSRYRYAEIKEDKKRRKSQSGKDVREQRSFISVKIHFDITKIKSSSSILPKKFWISRTWKPDSRFNTPIEENNIETEYLSKIKDRRTLKKGYQGLLSQSTTKLLKRIRFEYIPAIKDKNFHSYLFSKLQETILSSRSSTISKQSKELEAVILNSTNKLYDKFKKETGIDASIRVPDSLIDFFKAFETFTKLNSLDDRTPLTYRGDGIQSRFIPAVLNFIQENSNDIVLWGFEEPENSFEYSMMSELAQKFFNEYSNKIQIFLTTHSFIFISYKSTNSSKYRVFSSEINRISTDIIKLNDESSIGKLNLSQDTLSVLLGDIGIIELNKELKTFYDERKELLLKISREYEKKKKPLVITEGESDVLYLNFAWSQINPGISNPFDIQAVSYYINGQTTNGGYGNIRKIVELKNLTQAKIVGIFDNDSAFNEFNGLKLLKTKTPLIKENLENNTFALLLPEPAYREGYGKIHVLNIEHYFENKTFEKLKIQFLKNSTSILENNTALSVEHFTIIVSNKIALAKKIISSHTLTDNEKLGFKNLFDLLDHIIK